MKKLLMGFIGLILLFAVLTGVFTVVLFMRERAEPLAEGEIEPEEETFVSSRELRVIVDSRDSLRVQYDSLMAVLAARQSELDSLETELAYKEATIKGLDDRLQTQDAEIAELRQADVNAQEMARTFGTMSVDELTPIVGKLSDAVVLDIYQYTSSKRRRFLLAALGYDRAAALTNRLVKKKGS